MFKTLTPEAREHCIDEYYNIVCPYDTAGEREGATAEDLAENIITTLECCKDLSIDEKGNWYFDGERI